MVVLKNTSQTLWSLAVIADTIRYLTTFNNKMKHTFQIWTIQTILLTIFISLSISAYSQQKSKPNKYYSYVIGKQSLDSIFPIDNIQLITVTNNNGSHTLTERELVVLKEQLRQAKFAGGLLVKPGHIILSIKLRPNSKGKSGYVYAYNGMINFDGATDRFGKGFSGSYYLPLNINFDNYK